MGGSRIRENSDREGNVRILTNSATGLGYDLLRSPNSHEFGYGGRGFSVILLAVDIRPARGV
jgi:hypothetical protein